MSANPLIDPEAWDTLILGGEYTPGLARVKSSRVHKWDEKKGKGSQGSTLTYAGHDLAEVEVEIRMWEAEQYDEWESKVEQWLPDPKKPKGLDAVHPALELLKVRSVVTVSVGGVEIQPDGEMRVALKLREFLNPKPAGGTLSGSSSGSRKPGDAPPNVLDAQDQHLAALLKEAREP